MGRYKVDSATQKIITLDTLIGMQSGGSGIATVFFKIPIPDSRMRVKVSIPFIRPTGTAATGISATLWLYEADEDLSGVQGDLLPLANIEGTSAAPLSIPIDTGLLGYSREFISAADYIIGRIVTAGQPSTPGSWMLQTRYQPQAVRFTDAEWNSIASGCNPSAEMTHA